MERDDKMILIRDVPAAVIDALDGILATQGLARIALRELHEDWSPLLAETGGPTAFVLSEPQNEWTACFSSLEPDADWQLAEALAMSLEQPTIVLLISAASGQYAYRCFEEGVLREESLPDDEQPLTEATLMERLAAHGVPPELLDDRRLSFDRMHLLLGYASQHGHATAQAGDPAAQAPVDDEAPL